MVQWQRSVILLAVIIFGLVVHTALAQDMPELKAPILVTTNAIFNFSEASTQPVETITLSMPSALTATALTPTTLSIPQSLTPTLPSSHFVTTILPANFITIPDNSTYQDTTLTPLQQDASEISSETTSLTLATPSVNNVITEPEIQFTDSITTIISIQDSTPTISELETILNTYNVCGRIDLSYPSQIATLTISSATVMQTFIIQGDGTFCMDLPPAVYQLRTQMPHHLPALLEVTVRDHSLVITDIQLVKGDVNNDGFIDMRDAHLVIENFDLSVPPALGAADLNGDNLINISDLTIVSAHIGHGK